MNFRQHAAHAAAADVLDGRNRGAEHCAVLLEDAPLQGMCALIAAFVVFTHRSNIARMLAGRENRVRRLWLFRPRAT